MAARIEAEPTTELRATRAWPTGAQPVAVRFFFSGSSNGSVWAVA